MWFYFAVVAASVSGLFTVISKRTIQTIDSVVFFWIVTVLSIPFVFVYSLNQGFPQVDPIFFLGLLCSVILYSTSKLFFYNVIKGAELSLVYPLIALSPVFTSLFAFFILNEKISLVQFFGCLVTIVGIYIINIGSLREGILEPFRILYRHKALSGMLISVVLIGIVTVFDKLALNHTFPQEASFYLLLGNIMIAVVFLPWVMHKRKNYIQEIRSNIKPLVLLAILGTTSNLLIFRSLVEGKAGLVTSVFRVQIFFVLLFSFILFKDKPRKETILGTLVMLIGLFILKLF